MSPIVLGPIIQSVGKIADDLITTGEERAAAALEVQKLGLEAAKVEAGLVTTQIEVNQKEAEHASLFVSGWRPFVGWVCGLGLAYQFLMYPILTWFCGLAQALNWLSTDIQLPPPLNYELLFALVTGMLGLAAVRGAEKIKGVARK
jgi:hypothetical protein